MELVVNNKEEPKTDPIEATFQHWQQICNYRRARLDEKRRKLILARMKDGYSLEDMQDAINGCYLSAFHQGDNSEGKRYDDISLILRDAAHVDAFIVLYEEGVERLARIQQVESKPETVPASAEFARATLDKMRKLLGR